MKKTLIVLLIAVLAVGSAFATLNGTVTTTAAYKIHEKNFDVKTVGAIKGSYSLPFSKVFAGDKDFGKTDNVALGFPYADVEASLTVSAGSAKKATQTFNGTVKSANHNAAPTKYPVVNVNYANGWEDDSMTLSFVDNSLVDASLDITLDKAQIVGEKWVLDLLNGPKIANYSSFVSSLDATVLYPHYCDLDSWYSAKQYGCYEMAGHKFDSIQGYAQRIAELNDDLTGTNGIKKSKDYLDLVKDLAKLQDQEATFLANYANSIAADKNFKDPYGAGKTKAEYAKAITEQEAKIAAATKGKEAEIAAYSDRAEGFTFTWKEYGSVAVAAIANEEEAASRYMIQLSSVDYALTDELHAQASVTFDKYHADKLVTFLSGKANYVNGVEGYLTANVAVDALIDGNKKEDGGVEINADFAYDNNFIVGEGYYASKAWEYGWGYNSTAKTHKYDATPTEVAKYFTYFRTIVDGTEKVPTFTPVLTVEGLSYEDYKMYLNWDLAAAYVKDEVEYLAANIGMTDTLKNDDEQTLYGELATTVTNYHEMENIGELTVTVGAEDLLNLDEGSLVKKPTYSNAAKKSGFYVNVAAEDFLVEGLDFAANVANLCNENGQVFAAKVAYDDMPEDAEEVENRIQAEAGFATGLKNSAFKGENTYVYADASVKLDKLTVLAGASSLVDEEIGFYAGVEYANPEIFTFDAILEFAQDKGDNPDVGMHAKVSSDILVKGATLSIEYGKLDSYTGDLATTNNLSKKDVNDAITAKCVIKF